MIQLSGVEGRRGTRAALMGVEGRTARYWQAVRSQ